MDEFIRIFNDCEVLIENSVTRVTLLHHELSRLTEFSIRTEKPLWILFLAYSSFRITFMLENVLFYQIYAQITFFDQEIRDPRNAL